MEVPIEVRAYGDPSRPKVLVLHGGPGAPGSAASLARALSPRFRVLEPLQRRSGGAPLGVARHVADLAAVAPPEAVLVGWSWGAMLALSFAAAHPARVARLALVGCGTYAEADRAEYRRRMAGRLGADGRRLEEELEREVDPERRDALLARLGALAERAQDVDPLPEEAEAEGAHLAADARGHRETWDDALRLQRAGVEPAAFAAIRAPVLFAWGADDPHPGARTLVRLRRVLPRIEPACFPRCGHRPWVERAAREPFLRRLGGWLEGPTGPPITEP